MKRIFATVIFALALVSFAGCWGWDPIDPYNGGGHHGGGNHGGGNHGGCDSGWVDPGNGGIDSGWVDPGNGGIDTTDIDPWPVDSTDVPVDTLNYRHP